MESFRAKQEDRGGGGVVGIISPFGSPPTRMEYVKDFTHTIMRLIHFLLKPIHLNICSKKDYSTLSNALLMSSVIAMNPYFLDLLLVFIGIQESNFNSIFKLEPVKTYHLILTSKFLVRCMDNTIIFYVNFVWRMLYIYYSIFVIKICK